MAANFPISRAGLRSRRPTASSGLMAGAGRRWNPAACLPEKIAAPLLPSMSLKCGSPSKRRAQRLSAKAMAPAKAVGPPLVRCTTSPSRPQKPTRPNARLPPLAKPSDLSSIGKTERREAKRAPKPAENALAATRFGFHPDDTTPIPRPSSYYGRRQNPSLETVIGAVTSHQRRLSLRVRPPRAKIDKSVLALAEPKRRRDKAHLRFVASQPCLVCGRQPSDPHHLRFAQPRALGVKVSDEFTVPLCRGHHRQLHQAGNEVAWWQGFKIEALQVARRLWEQSHPSELQIETETTKQSDSDQAKANS